MNHKTKIKCTAFLALAMIAGCSSLSHPVRDPSSDTKVIDEGPKDELKWCKTIELKDYKLKPAVFEAFSKSENVGYENVRTLVKEIFEEKDFKLINEPMADIEKFCPSYKKLSDSSKEDFFGHLLANIARYESNYVNGDAFTEENGNVSRGQLSISYKSQNNSLYRERGCDIITKETDLADAKSNLQCGLAIISRWVEQDHVLAQDDKKGASRYWSTLRAPYLTCLNKVTRTEEEGKAVYKYTGRVITVGFKDIIVRGIKEKMPACFKK